MVIQNLQQQNWHDQLDNNNVGFSQWLSKGKGYNFLDGAQNGEWLEQVNLSSLNQKFLNFYIPLTNIYLFIPMI